MRGTRLAESEKITGITLLGRNIDIELPIYIHLYSGLTTPLDFHP